MNNDVQNHQGRAGRFGQVAEMLVHGSLPAPQAEPWGVLAQDRQARLTPEVRAKLAGLAIEAQRLPAPRF